MDSPLRSYSKSTQTGLAGNTIPSFKFRSSLEVFSLFSS